MSLEQRCYQYRSCSIVVVDLDGNGYSIVMPETEENGYSIVMPETDRKSYSTAMTDKDEIAIVLMRPVQIK